MVPFAMVVTLADVTPFGALLKSWRTRRRLSQLDLALAADVSARHISFLETGRAHPSRLMILRLAEALETPLADRNALLAAAGFAAAYSWAPLDDRALRPVKRALTRMMDRHAPYPAVLIDRLWRIVDANPSGWMLFGGDQTGRSIVSAICDDPDVRSKIINWGEVALSLAARLRAESRHVGGDPALNALAEKLARDPECAEAEVLYAASLHQPALTVQILMGDTELSFFSTIAQIGSPRDVTLTDLRVELFFPTDPVTEAAFGGPEWASSMA